MRRARIERTIRWLSAQVAGAIVLLSGATLVTYGLWRLLVAVVAAPAPDLDPRRDALPVRLRVAHIIASAPAFSELLMNSLVPTGGGGVEQCGGVVFQMDESTRRGLIADGLNFLDIAPTGFGKDHAGHHRGPRWDPWQPTPVPPTWPRGGRWEGLNCLKESGFASAPILTAAAKPGSYFTSTPGAELLVIPSLDLVVLTHRR